MNMSNGSANAVNIIPLSNTPPSAVAESSDIAFYRLILAIRDMLKRCQSEDRNTQAMLAITALIEGGVNTGPRIVGTAKNLGFKPAHFGAVLKKSTGSVRGHHLWNRKSGGVYEVLGPASEPQLVTVPDLF
ncbi:hypothetical protein [Sphingomonas melonis]